MLDIPPEKSRSSANASPGASGLEEPFRTGSNTRVPVNSKLPSTLPNSPTMSRNSILRGLSSFLEKKGYTARQYCESELRQYWMPDANCRVCYHCDEKFTTFRRRHHCRICGQIFCGRCSDQEVPGNLVGVTGTLRACSHCAALVMRYAQTSCGVQDIRV